MVGELRAFIVPDVLSVLSLAMHDAALGSLKKRSSLLACLSVMASIREWQ